MIYVAWFVWIAIWGTAGYLTVRTIQIRREHRRIAEEIARIKDFYNSKLRTPDVEEEL